MTKIIIAAFSIVLISGCYCSCKYPSDYMMPEYDYKKYKKTKDAYHNHQQRKIMQLYDYDNDYQAPYGGRHDDYIPARPGYYEEDFINAYPVGR